MLERRTGQPLLLHFKLMKAKVSRPHGGTVFSQSVNGECRPLTGIEEHVTRLNQAINDSLLERKAILKISTHPLITESPG